MKTNINNKVRAGVFYSLLLSLLLPSFSSCADLEYTEETTRDEEWTFNYFNEGIKGLVSGVYAQVYNNEFESNSAYFLAGATDEAQYALETGAINNYINGGWSPANPYDRVWTKSYTAIADANMFLEKLEQTDISDWQYHPNYKDWVAQLELFPYELRFLRAYFYFELFKTYGDVPLVTTTLTNGQANNVKRTPASEIVKFIVEECDAIAPYLPVSYETEIGSEVGRATRVAVAALKARTLLYAASPLHNPDNNKDKWIAFVGLKDGMPYEIFTGLADDEEGILLPKSVTKGKIIRVVQEDGTKRYDFQFVNARGFKTTMEGLSYKFDKEYWNYAKLISGVLRYGMPIDQVIKMISGLQMDSESINSWKVGVERALKKYIQDGTVVQGQVCPNCGQPLVFEEGCMHCRECGYSKCGG